MAAVESISRLHSLPDIKIVELAQQPYTGTTVNHIYLSNVKDKYRAQIFAMRIRLVELFQDFDKLRSGLMTISQFRRCVAASMNKCAVSPLSEVEISMLQENYIDRKTNMVRWREFVDSIDTVFGAKQLENSPTTSSEEVIKPFRRPLSPSSEETLAKIISMLKSYVKHHGSDVKSWFKDFDKYNNGYVTYNQFRRGIPQNLLSISEEDLLLSKYSEIITGTVNYFKMNTDVNRKAPRPLVAQSQLVAKFKSRSDWYDEHVPVGTEELFYNTNQQSYESDSPKIDAIENKIKKYIYKNRIRLIDFFRDYDRHNCGLITLPQFFAGVSLASLPIDALESPILISHYQDYTGRVNYRRFCTSIDSIFTTNHLEQDPLYNVKPVSREWLMHGPNELSEAEEKRCSQIILRYQEIMKKNRLLLAPYFKDFDKHLGNTGRVTRSHFSRILSTNRLDVSDNDLHILFKKFEDRTQGRINYMEFIRTIDPEKCILYNNSLKNIDDHDVKMEKSSISFNDHRARALPIENILTKIRSHVGSKRIRISEFFKDFDKLRSYSIRRADFIRGLGCIGLHLSEFECDIIAERYRDEGKQGYFKWKEFEKEIDQVSGELHLESLPKHTLSSKMEYTSPFALAKCELSPQETALLARTMDNIYAHQRRRQCNVKSFFRDFDKVCTGTGHVTKSQFRRCLTYMKCQVTDEEFEVICKRWTKLDCSIDESSGVPMENCSTIKKDFNREVDQKINYLLFLEDVERGANGNTVESTEVFKKNKDFTKLPRTATPTKESEKLPALVETGVGETEFEKLMMRIKIKAKTERIRVIDFMADFDHLKHGRITKNEFRRAIKVLYADLTEADLQELEAKFKTPQDPRYINYKVFSDVVESVFTKKGLEKTPTEKVDDFNVYSNGWEADPSVNILTEKDSIVLEAVLDRLAQKVEERRIDVISYMKGYDFMKEGTITTNQFRSVLNSVNLGVTDKEMLVLTKYLATNKSMTRLNYRKLAQS
ncbi:hypothetical protein BASA50_010600 [Batrachochytrium salamandrivorans]|uniref:EF-hand domain-containing protein n=1 Tax=Batrachochytrium salamandrivorans TaxID=1357716 RepID=A0ABQ8EY22_9FUNG|nr:hypothetical protein BASA50_010600 [Batrachochytrium salamandrivorans]